MGDQLAAPKASIGVDVSSDAELDADGVLTAHLLMSRIALEIADISAAMRDVEGEIIVHMSSLRRKDDKPPFPDGLQRIDRILQRLNGISELLAALAPETQIPGEGSIEAAIKEMRLAEQARNLRHGHVHPDGEAAAQVVLF